MNGKGLLLPGAGDALLEVLFENDLSVTLDELWQDEIVMTSDTIWEHIRFLTGPLFVQQEPIGKNLRILLYRAAEELNKILRARGREQMALPSLKSLLKHTGR